MGGGLFITCTLHENVADDAGQLRARCSWPADEQWALCVAHQRLALAMLPLYLPEVDVLYEPSVMAQVGPPETRQD